MNSTKTKIDWSKVSKGTKILVKRNQESEPFEARFSALASWGDVYFFIEHSNGRILSKENPENVSLLVQDEALKTVEVGCLRADRIPQDCDCCERYDSRICPPIATQYKNLKRLCTFSEWDRFLASNSTPNKFYEIFKCKKCGYCSDSHGPVCPACNSIMNYTEKSTVDFLIKNK